MSKKRLVTLILSIGIFLSLAATAFAAGQPRRYNENSTVTYEVLFTHDNSYYTHCYHQTMSYYNSGASAPFRTDTDYYQAVGG